MTSIGKIVLMPRGDYDSTATYNHLDWVRHNGAAWVCKQDNVTNVTPVEGAAWTLLAQDSGGGSVSEWGDLTGDIQNQTDLIAELDKKTTELTKAQYDALPSADKNDPDTIYFVPDYDPDIAMAVLDDETVGNDSVWSSEKTDTTKCDNSIIAPVESGTTASKAYAIGEHFIKDGAFCTVIADISSGAALTLDTNYKAGQIDATSLLAGKILTSNDNLDNIKDFGIYSWGVSYPTNSPINGSASMLVIRYATAGVHQIVYTPYLTCIRIYSGGEWTTFRKAVTYDSVSSGTLTMKSGITGTIGNATCYKKNGMVCVGGRITGASTSADKAIVNVPSGFRPLQKTWGMNCAYDTITGKYVFGSVAVDTNGDIIYYITTNNCSTFYFQFTYPVD